MSSDYINKWRNKRRAYALKKLGGECSKCGSRDRLEFDHVNPATKTLNIGRMWTAAKGRFEVELAKCQLLCKSCHKQKTIEEQTKPLLHGTLSGYAKKKCRCEACTKRWNEYQKKWKHGLLRRTGKAADCKSVAR